MDSNLDIHVPVEKQEINLTIYNLKESLIKLCSLTDKLDISKNTDAEPCGIVDLSWLHEEKCKIVDNVESLKDFTLNLNTTEAEMLIDLYITLVQQNKQLEDIQNTWEKGSKTKTFYDFTKENQKFLATSEVDTPDKLNVNLLLKKSGEKFLETRNNFHAFLDLHFKNTNIKQLLQDLTVAYFRGGDNAYINIADSDKYSFSDINLLKLSNIITENPYDHMKIKINDFFDM